MVQSWCSNSTVQGEQLSGLSRTGSWFVRFSVLKSRQFWANQHKLVTLGVGSQGLLTLLACQHAVSILRCKKAAPVSIIPSICSQQGRETRMGRVHSFHFKGISQKLHITRCS